MAEDRHPLDDQLRGELAALVPGAVHDVDHPIVDGSGLTVGGTQALFDAQCRSRHADFAARWLQARGRGFYTIASAGHEANAGVAAATRPDDPALLHYRSGGFYCVRADRAGIDGVRDILAGAAAAVTEPMSGGRHKVFGRVELAVIPQTSTIASHVPRAFGLAFALRRARRLGHATPYPPDAVVITSFGDASANHSTLLGAVNAAANASFQGLAVPLLLVCEDNGYGISTPTPAGWIAERFGTHPQVRYVSADGTDVVAVHDATLEAVATIRATGRPVFLHLPMVRFLGHAGSDAELGYRSAAAIAADYPRDPLLRTARHLAAAGVSGTCLLQRYEQIRSEVGQIAAEMVDATHLVDAAAVRCPLARRSPARVRACAVGDGDPAAPSRPAADRPPEDHGRITLAASINRALRDELARRPNVLLFGEDVAVKGGVYGVTKGLRRAFGGGRVFDTILDEQSILGLALGSALAGFLPIPEIQYLAYLHNAEDQLRGEAASLQFFSDGQYRNPMVVRIPGLGYQRGFGGHFHNDNSVAVLRDIPGLLVAVPAHPADAPALLRTLLASAEIDGSVGVFLEPIALYHERDLYTAGDGQWLARYAEAPDWAETHIPIGSARTWAVDDGPGTALTMVSFGNGVPMSLRVARVLSARGVSARVVDLRWLNPLPERDLLAEAEATGRVLVVDETRHSGGVGEAILACLVQGGFRGEMARVSSADSFIPLGPAAHTVLLDEAQILQAAERLLNASGR